MSEIPTSTPEPPSANETVQTRLGLTQPLEERLYKLRDDEFEFYRKETSIQDAEEIKKHILNVQAEAYAVSGHVHLI